MNEPLTVRACRPSTATPQFLRHQQPSQRCYTRRRGQGRFSSPALLASCDGCRPDPEGMDPTWLAAHEARIRAERERVTAELRRLGLPEGNALKVCTHCGAETVYDVHELVKIGWAYSPEVGWFCDLCAPPQLCHASVEGIKVC